LLLDTHVFLWLLASPRKLPHRVRAACESARNELVLSIVSAWELQIKIDLGKLKLVAPVRELIEEQQRENSLELLPITLPHLSQLSTLPALHSDPFDRMLAAQAKVEGARLVSADDKFAGYPVKVFW
jgi:PIN domain nuclease of toxin-antitoxin system